MVSTRNGKQYIGKKRHTIAQNIAGNITKQEKMANPLNTAISHETPVHLFYFALELGSALVWEYLCAEDISNLLRVCSNGLSEEFVHNVLLKAIDHFATENELHLGRLCGCDWMRSIDFIPRSDDKCTETAPFDVNKALLILQIPGGPRALLNALVITMKLKKSLCRDRSGAARFVPLICPLITNENKLCSCTQEEVMKAMNGIWQSAGSRYFHDYKRSRGRTILDYMDQHWRGMEGTFCQYCKNLTYPRRNFTQYKLKEFKVLRSHCADIYRPLKAGLTKHLQFVRLVPRRRGIHGLQSALRPGGYYGPYEGLVAGITEDGILCGFYQVDGFKAICY